MILIDIFFFFNDPFIDMKILKEPAKWSRIFIAIENFETNKKFSRENQGFAAFFFDRNLI